MSGLPNLKTNVHLVSANMVRDVHKQSIGYCSICLHQFLLLRREHAQKELEWYTKTYQGSTVEKLVDYWRGRLDELNEQLGEEK